MSDHDDRGERSAPANEGVRILGAQEAAAIEADRRATTGDGDDADLTDRIAVVDIDADEPAEALAVVDEPSWEQTSAAAGPTWSAQASADDGGEDPDALDSPPWLEPPTTGGATSTEPLPHWSEPPTGQVPVVGADEARFRGSGDDWSDADVAALSDSSEDDARLGAMSGAEPEVPDDDAAFVAAVRARRRSGTRAVVTSTPGPRAAGTAPRGPVRRPSASAPGDVLPSSSGGGGGRDLSVALATAGVFGAIALGCFALGQSATGLLTAAVLAVCAFELCAALQAKGLKPATLPVVVACAAAPLVALRGSDVTSGAGAASGLGPFSTLFALVTLVSFLWFLWRVGPGRPVVGVATSMLVFTYVGGLGAYAGLLLHRGPDGVGLLLGTLLCVIAYDAIGYFAGSRLGSAPIAPETSPSKTVEGTLSGVLGAVLVAVVILPRFAPWAHHKLLVLAATGLLLGVAALIGDLCESMLKRDLGIKDFGTLLPGHGGFLDRFDGLLFALPVAYFVTLHLKLF